MYRMLYMLYFARLPVRRNWPSSSDCALFKMLRLVRNRQTAFVRTIFQRRRFGLDITFHLIHPRHDHRLGGIGRVVQIGSNQDQSACEI